MLKSALREAGKKPRNLDHLSVTSHGVHHFELCDIYIYIYVLFTRPWTKEIFPSRPWTKEIPNTFHLFNATLTCSILYWSIYCRCMYLYMIRIYADRYDRKLTHIHTYIQTEKHRNIEHMHIRTSKSTHAHANIHTCIHAYMHTYIHT